MRSELAEQGRRGVRLELAEQGSTSGRGLMHGVASSTFEKCFLPLSSSVGGGFWSVMSRTFMGGNLAKGAWPCAISSSEIPNDQISAALSYLCRVGGGRS